MDLENSIQETKKLIDYLRKNNIADFEIIKTFGLKYNQVGTKTMEIYNKIKNGDISLKDSLQVNAKKCGLTTKSSFKYHLDKLVEYGYILR